MKSILTLIIGVLLGLLVGGLMYLSVRTPVGVPIQLMPSSTPKPIVVYVNGAVKHPGVYRLPVDSHLVDAIESAGGFLGNADYSQLNLADKVSDGDQFFIPGTGQLPTPVLNIGGNGLLFTPTPPAGALVNINSADTALLDQLPGIGPTAAQKIVDYRTQNGPYTRIEDLLKVPGIGPTVLEEIRGLITIGK
ncbi:MAG: ComEA family DNA-binding protein [Chloroflexota bacterium]